MWGMLPVLVLAGISGIFYPIQQLWGWVQVVAQVVPDVLDRPRHALGLPARRGRSRGDRRLVAHRPRRCWCSAPGRSSGLLVTPVVLRRMARRQTGSQVEAAREAAMQWVR